jgi:hypothetical protein
MRRCAILPALNGSDKRHKPELADVFTLYGEQYCQNNPLPPSQHKVMHDIKACRSSALGGHLEQCDACGFERPAYNSCRNRHCPKCQALAKARWLEARKAELLPVGYFHDVFTLPHELNPIALANKRIIYNMLFRSVSETLLEFGKDPKHRLGGKIGFIATLHTWNQTLIDHIHLHCLVPAGAISFDGKSWIHASQKFLFPVKALSRAFRQRFIRLLKKAFEKGELIFPGKTASLGTKKGFSRLIDLLWKKDWVVYSKKPFQKPEYVLDYLARYVHRVAISNERIISTENGTITFWYKQRRRKQKPIKRKMSLKPDEFIRRFLLHVLPDDFMRIRYFGFLSNRYRKERLSQCRELLGICPEPPQITQKTCLELIFQLIGLDISICPHCKNGKMRIIKEIPKPLNLYSYKPQILDSS